MGVRISRWESKTITTITIRNIVLMTTRDELIKKIESDKKIYGIESYEIVGRSISIKTKKGFQDAAAVYIGMLNTQFPDLINGGNVTSD